MIESHLSCLKMFLELAIKNGREQEYLDHLDQLDQLMLECNTEKENAIPDRTDPQ